MEADEDVVQRQLHSKYEVPILMDVYGLTPLDYCLGITAHLKDVKGIYKPTNPEMEKSIANFKTPQLAEIIFDGIKDYRLNSVGPAIIPSIVEAVKKLVPTIFTFLDSRMRRGHYIHVNSMNPIKA